MLPILGLHMSLIDRFAVDRCVTLLCNMPGLGTWPDFDGPLHSRHVSDSTDAAGTADQVSLKAALNRSSR